MACNRLNVFSCVLVVRYLVFHLSLLLFCSFLGGMIFMDVQLFAGGFYMCSYVKDSRLIELGTLVHCGV